MSELPINAAEIEATYQPAAPAPASSWKRPDFSMLDETLKRIKKGRRIVQNKMLLSEHLRNGRMEYYLNEATGEVMVEKVFLKHSEKWLNYIDTYLKIKTSRMAGQINRRECVPQSNTESEIRKAAAGTALLEYYAAEMGEREMVKNLCDWLPTYGMLFLHAYWDSAALAIVPMMVEETTPPMTEGLAEGVEYIGRRRTQVGWIDAYQGPFGDVRSEIVLPFALYIPPGVERFEDCTSFFRQSVKPMSWVRTHAPHLEGQIFADRIDSTRTGDAQMNYDSGIWFEERTEPDEHGSQRLSEKAGYFAVTEYYEYASGQWHVLQYATQDAAAQRGGKGRASRILISESTFRDHGYTGVTTWRNPGQFYPKPTVLNLIDPQRNICKMQIQMALSEKRARKPLMMLSAAHTFIKDDDFHIVKLQNSPGAAPPVFQNLPNNFPMQSAYRNDQKETMKDLLNLYPISQANPQGVRAGVAIQQLRAEQSNISDAEREYIDLALIRHSQAMLRVAYDNYDEARAAGKFDDSEQTYVITKDFLHSKPNVRVVGGGLLPTDKQERLDFGMQLLNAGVFEPGREEAVARMVEWMGGSKNDINILTPGPYRCKEATDREHRGIEEGRVLAGAAPDGSPQPWAMWDNGEPVADEFQAHADEIREHVRFTRTDRFLGSWNAAMREMLRIHIRNHQALMAPAAAPLAPEANAGAPAGGPAAAPQMPGVPPGAPPGMGPSLPPDAPPAPGGPAMGGQGLNPNLIAALQAAAAGQGPAGGPMTMAA